MLYKYKPLSDSEWNIRVALLHAGNYDDEITVSFRVQQLNRKAKQISVSSIVRTWLNYIVTRSVGGSPRLRSSFLRMGFD